MSKSIANELRNTFMTTNEDRVVLTIEEYCDLIKDSQTLDTLLHAIFENAILTYDQKLLHFDDFPVCLVLSALCRPQYYAVLNNLKRKEEEKNGTDKSEE